MKTREDRKGRAGQMIWALGALLVIFFATAGVSSCGEPPDPKLGPAVVLRNAAGRDWTVQVEVARTREEQTRGLMFRWSLAPDRGMIFIYDRPDNHTFWMRNTRIPLDMIFIGEDRRIVGIVEKAEPYTDTGRSVAAPSQWVLEVNGGEAKAHGIKAGDQVYFFQF